MVLISDEVVQQQWPQHGEIATLLILYEEHVLITWMSTYPHCTGIYNSHALHVCNASPKSL